MAVKAPDRLAPAMASGSEGSPFLPDDGDALLNIVGAVLVVAVVGGIVFVGLLVAGGGPDGGRSPPAAEWTLERINDTHVRIVHAGGDPVRVGDLVVTADGRERHPSWSAGTLTEGEAGVFRATRARALVRLYWTGDRGRDLLETWRI